MEDNVTTEINEADDGYLDFAAAFGEDIGNQTESDTETDKAEQEASEEPGDEQSQEEPEEEKHDEDAETAEAPAESAPGNTPDTEPPQDIFTLKVNREERTVNREEVISLAQKGADYDRVKQQLSDTRQENQGLRDQIGQMEGKQRQLDEQRDALEILQMLAQKSGVTAGQFADQLYMTYQKGRGMSDDAAREMLQADRQLRQANALKEKEGEKSESQKRAERELSDFKRQFPDVQLTTELWNSLKEDVVNNSMTLAGAYTRYENERVVSGLNQQIQSKDQQISTLQSEVESLRNQLAAEKQNKANRASSPGSLSDSGGTREKSDFDIFSGALFD